MNRGQAPQRPPNLGVGVGMGIGGGMGVPTQGGGPPGHQSQGMSNAFRSPYHSAYAMGMPRGSVPNVGVGGVVGGGMGMGSVGMLQGYPNPNSSSQQTQGIPMGQHRQGLQSQGQSGGPTPNLFSQRSAVSGGFPFGVGILQQQQSQSQSQGQGGSSVNGSLLSHLQSMNPSQPNQGPGGSNQHSPQSLSQQAHGPSPGSSLPSQSNTQQPDGSSTANSTTTGQSTDPTPGGTTQNQGLDPNEFPALGSNSTANTNGTSGPSSTTGTGTGLTPVIPPNLPSSYASQAGVGVPLTSGSGSGAIGSGGAPGLSNASTKDFGPEDFPALGGESHTNANGAISAGYGESMSVGRRFGDADSRKFSLKPGSISNPNWSSPGTNPSSANVSSTTTPGLTNGLHPPPLQGHALTPGLGGIPLSTSLFAGANSPSPNPNNPAPPETVTNTNTNGNGNPSSVAGGTSTNPGSGASGGSIPQTPAQQILTSPADRWGLLGLLALIRSADHEASLLGIGNDLGTVGLDMSVQGNLYSTFITPWSDSSAAHLVEPDFHLPGCYNVQPAALTPSKAAAFSDETLFFMFYAHPRDMLQEVAAQELWNRNWRYHKDLRVWLTKETGTSPSQKQPGGELGMFTIWDSENWEKTRKRIQVAYSDLEEKTNPVFPLGIGIGGGAGGMSAIGGGMNALGQTQSSGQGQQGQGNGQSQSQQQSQQQSQGPSREPGTIPVGRFAGMGMSVGA